MRGPLGVLGRRSGVISAVALTAACSPKVHLEFEDELENGLTGNLAAESSSTEDASNGGREDDLLVEDDWGSPGGSTSSPFGQPDPGTTSSTSTRDDTRTTASTSTTAGPSTNTTASTRTTAGPSISTTASASTTADPGTSTTADPDTRGPLPETTGFTTIADPGGSSGNDSTCIYDEDCSVDEVCIESTCQRVVEARECGSPSPLVSTHVATDFSTISAMAYGDFNGDGIQGMVIDTELGLWFLDEPSPATLFSTGTPASSGGLAAGDFDGNGLDDVIRSRDDTVVWLNLGLGLEPENSFSYGHGVQQLHVADLDRDGALDFATVNRGSVDVFFGFGDGTFAEEANFSGYTLSVGSFGPDRAPALVLSGISSVSIVQFDTLRTPYATTLFHSPSFHNGSLLSDLDGDGSIDLLTFATRNTYTLLSVWPGAESGLHLDPLRIRLPGSFTRVVPSPPQGHYAIFGGPSGQVHLRDLTPPCWSLLNETPVIHLVSGRQPPNGEALVATRDGLYRIGQP